MPFCETINVAYCLEKGASMLRLQEDLEAQKTYRMIRHLQLFFFHYYDI